MRTIIIASFFCLSSGLCLAQQWQLSGDIGYAKYAMGDLRTRQENFSKYGLTPQSIQNFPPFAFFRARVLYKVSTLWKTGLIYGYESTGARSDYQDFSGQLRFDQEVYSHNAGWVNSFDVKVSPKFTLSNQIIVWRAFSNLRTEETLSLVNAPSPTVTDYYKSTSTMLEYNLFGNYAAGHFLFGAFIGYNADFKGTLKQDDEPTGAKTDWSGFRSGLSVTVTY